MHCFVTTSAAWCKYEMVSELQIILNPLLPDTSCFFTTYVICVDIVNNIQSDAVPDDPYDWFLKSGVWACLHFFT